MTKSKAGKTRIIVLSVLAIIILAAGWFASQRFFKPNNYRTARVADLKGEVTVIKNGAQNRMIAFQGMSLTPGDQLQTEADSWALLEIGANEKEIKIFAKSQVRISELERENKTWASKTILEMLTGKLAANLKKKLDPRQKFEIRTPTTVAGARGTLFYVEYRQGKTKVAVLEGRVGVALRGRKASEAQRTEVTLAKNQQTVIEKSMTTVSEIPVDEIKTDSLDRDFIEYIQENPARVETKVLEEIKTLIANEDQAQNQPEAKPTEDKGPVGPEQASQQTPTSRQGSTNAQQGQTAIPTLKKSELIKQPTIPEPTPPNLRGIMGHLEVPEGTVIPAGGVEITIFTTRLRSSRSKIEQYQTTVKLEPGQWKVNYMIGVSPNYESNDGYVVNYSFNPAQLPGIQPKGYYLYQDGVGLKVVTKAQGATLVDVSHGDRGGVDLFLANFEESKP